MQVLVTTPHVWCSLLAAREIIWEGAVWKVRDGRKIQVSKNRWLSHKPVFLGEERPNMLVSDLMDTETKQWDRGKISTLFAYRTRMEILSIPLQNSTAQDKMEWNESRNRIFTVKSAYKVALRIQENTQAEHSRAGLDRPMWKKIWKLNIPPKVRNFLWRACSNILPTRENLHRRRVQVEPWCELCCQCTETVAHMLWECPLARNVWHYAKEKCRNVRTQSRIFFSLFKMVVDRFSQQEIEQWATVSWSIWSARNKFCFEKFQRHPEQIMREATGFLLEYQMLQNAQV
uniref:Reverse transcriptase zinc-binding domain-containing protein n=1 Tax=Quercus lobata TaxID=97700 RepID=A0A7N2LHE6_QUELO